MISDRAEFDLAKRLRSEGAPLGEVFAFLSGLYFRGKLAYSHKFGSTSFGLPAALVITAGKGMLPSDHKLTLDQLEEFSRVNISLDDQRYLDPLERDLRELSKRLAPSAQVVLLGSLATPKYLSPLGSHLGHRLHFPADFRGRGDMSRGSIMLRAVREDRELLYRPAAELAGDLP